MEILREAYESLSEKVLRFQDHIGWITCILADGGSVLILEVNGSLCSNPLELLQVN